MNPTPGGGCVFQSFIHPPSDASTKKKKRKEGEREEEEEEEGKGDEEKEEEEEEEGGRERKRPSYMTRSMRAFTLTRRRATRC